MTAARQIWAILRKDIVLELRTKEMLISMFIFVMLTMVIFNYAFAAEKTDLTPFGGGMLWVAFTYTSLLGLNRSFSHEKDENCLEGLLLSPMDRSYVFVAKVLGNLLFISIIELVTVPIFTVFFIRYNYAPNLLIFLAGLFLGSVAISTVGTFLATITVNTRISDMLFPILALPIMMPALTSIVIISGATMAGPITGITADQIGAALQFLLGYDIVFLVVGYGIYDFVLGE